MNNFKSQRKTFSVPALISGLIDHRAKQLGYKSVSSYILGLVLFDLWAKKPHALTQQICNEDSEEMREAVIREIVECFECPSKPSSYFEHRLTMMAKEIAMKNGGDKKSAEN